MLLINAFGDIRESILKATKKKFREKFCENSSF
jgi:hypothetical protein